MMKHASGLVLPLLLLLGWGCTSPAPPDRLTDASLSFLETHQAHPFFLVLSHYAVHTPLQAPEEVTARFAEKAAARGPDDDTHYEAERTASTKLRQDHPTYAAMIERTDASVGRILDKLDELELDDHTVIVFVSDNGGLSTLMRRGFSQATANVPLRAGKGWLYEGGIRAPLIVRWPGHGSPGTVVDAPAMSTDLFPTLLAMADLPALPEQHLDGKNLAKAMTNEEVDVHEALYWHFPHYHGSGNRPGGAVRVGDLKLIEWFEDGATELYDLSADLGERRDLTAERPEDATRLLEALQTWRARVDANLPTQP